MDEYERMIDFGIIEEGARVELLDGEIIEMATIKPPHASIADRMNDILVRRRGERALVKVANPVRMVPRSEPEPDFALVRYRADFYATAHPTPADTFVVIEVSDSSLRKDLSVKVPICARQGVPEVWVVDIAGERVLVHLAPGDRRYGTVRTAKAGETLSPQLLPELSITVDEIFGR